VLWVYLLLATLGLVMIVPTVLRAIDGKPSDVLAGFIAFASFIGGVTGLFVSQVVVSGVVAFIAAGALGLAAGAIHPELLTTLRVNAKRTHDES
jgi:hypothetical protein